MQEPTQTLTLTDFLLARIAEDEAVAREVQANRDREVNPDMSFDWADDVTGGPCVTVGAERMLAECEAKRRIVATVLERARILGVSKSPSIELRYLASPYADHPDYRAEWKPDV